MCEEAIQNRITLVLRNAAICDTIRQKELVCVVLSAVTLRSHSQCHCEELQDCRRSKVL